MGRLQIINVYRIFSWTKNGMKRNQNSSTALFTWCRRKVCAFGELSWMLLMRESRRSDPYATVVFSFRLGFYQSFIVNCWERFVQNTESRPWALFTHVNWLFRLFKREKEWMTILQQSRETKLLGLKLCLRRLISLLWSLLTPPPGRQWTSTRPFTIVPKDGLCSCNDVLLWKSLALRNAAKYREKQTYLRRLVSDSIMLTRIKLVKFTIFSQVSFKGGLAIVLREAERMIVP